jgi:hypothetical protein
MPVIAVAEAGVVPPNDPVSLYSLIFRLLVIAAMATASISFSLPGGDLKYLAVVDVPTFKLNTVREELPELYGPADITMASEATTAAYPITHRQAMRHIKTTITMIVFLISISYLLCLLQVSKFNI